MKDGTPIHLAAAANISNANVNGIFNVREIEYGGNEGNSADNATDHIGNLAQLLKQA